MDERGRSRTGGSETYSGPAGPPREYFDRKKDETAPAVWPLQDRVILLVIIIGFVAGLIAFFLWF